MSKRASPNVKFLIVDDLDENLLALEALLRRDGLEILVARSGQDALELLLEHDVALALIDVQMPDMDGFELAELMRGAARTRAVPIIFVTAGATEESRVFRGYDAGAVDFLHKPIDPHILRHKTETFFLLDKQRQQLAETLRLNETFVAAVGHDLRSPLSAILTAAELLVRSADAPDQKMIAERVRSSGRRMAAMIDDLFDLARARLGGGIPLVPADSDFGAVVQKVVAEQRQAHPNRVIDVEIVGDMQGFWDARRLEQVVSNLVGNADRHGAADSPIEVSATGSSEAVSLRVHNAGVIPDDVMPRLFDPFRRSAEHSRDGLGLGLFIVHQTVTSHGGRIDVSTHPKDGTTFTVTLPRRTVVRPSLPDGMAAVDPRT